MEITSTNNYTEPENGQDAAEESDSSLPDLEHIMPEEPDSNDELPPHTPIWMRNIRLTPIVESVSESKEKVWEDDLFLINLGFQDFYILQWFCFHF